METEYTSLIERYFDNLLSPEEMTRVEQLRKTDLNFQEEFELFEKAHQAIKFSTIIDLKAEIKGIHQGMNDSSKEAKTINLRWIAVAASILIIVSVGLYAQQFSNQNLYSEAYTPVSDYITNMDGDLSEMEKAMKFLDQKQFDSASYLFNNIYATTGEQSALFYAGHSHFQAGRIEKAIESWNKVSNNYQAETQWYVALAYLKLGNTENSLKTLTAIITKKEDEVFVRRAEKLKEKLSSPFRKLSVN